MADDKANNLDTGLTAGSSTGQDSGMKSKLLVGLVILNMMVVVGVGFMLWKSKQVQPTEIQQIVEGEKKTQEVEKVEVEEVGKVVPLETFIVNMAGSKGRKVLKVNMDLEVKGADVVQEIDNRKAQIRDFIIIILSGKSYEEVSVKEGKEQLRNEIKDNINTFLAKGKVSNVYFTEFIYN